MLIEYRAIAWWYWLVSAVLLAVGVAGRQGAFVLAMVLALIQVVHFAMEDESVKSLAVQVRVAFLLILIVCYQPPLRWLFWLPLISLTARVLTGYCFMARTLALLPWNRQEPLTGAFVKRIYLTPPVSGSIIQKVSGTDEAHPHSHRHPE